MTNIAQTTAQNIAQTNTDTSKPAFIRIQEYSLAEALVEAQKGALAGYTIDLGNIEGYPTQIVNCISFNMVLVGEDAATNANTDSTTATVAIKPQKVTKVDKRFKPTI